MFAASRCSSVMISPLGGSRGVLRHATAASKWGSLEKEEAFNSRQHEAPRGKPVVSRLSLPLANAVRHSAILMSYTYVATRLVIFCGLRRQSTAATALSLPA